MESLSSGYGRRTRRSGGYRFKNHKIGLAVLVVLGLLIGGFTFVRYNTLYKRTVTVCSKERASTSGGGEYRIYTDKGTFVMKDSWFGKTRFNTADAYGKLKVNTTYDITYKGWRIPPILSWFPNILSFSKAKQQTPQVCNN